MKPNSYSIPLYSSDVKFEIRNTNFRKAEYYGEVFREKPHLKFEDSENEKRAINKFYTASGLKFVMEALINKRPIEDKIQNIFAEIITVASTIQEKKITSFMAVLEDSNSTFEETKKNIDQFKLNVDTRFQTVIKGLEKKDLLTYKKDFFLQPDKPLALISLGVPQKPESQNSTAESDLEITHNTLKTDYFFKELDTNRTAKTVVNATSNDCKLWLKKDLILNRSYEKIYREALQKNKNNESFEVNNHNSHREYHYAFASDKTKCSALLSIPFISSAGIYNENKIGTGENPKFQGYGALFIFIEFKKITEQDEEIVREALEDCAREVAVNVGKFAVNYLFATAKDLYEQTQKKARQAAIAQVMLRNMSHNIGSHVLSRMVTSETATGYQTNGQYHQVKGLNSESETKPYADLAWFNSYLKTRMDFLADIATSVPVMEDTRMLLAEVIAGLDLNRILLNNISGVENFNYSICVKDCRTGPNNSCEPLIVTSGKDIPIAVPNDILGFHALYIILENVIRNTAKHGSKVEHNNHIVFTIEIHQCVADESLYEVWLYDNCSMKNDRERSSNERRGLVHELNEKINSEVLDSKSALRQGGWGMIEMKVSAAYLRKIAVSDVDEEQYKFSDKPTTPLILKAKGYNDFLAYGFHLMKPKQMIVVDEKGTLYDELAKETLGNKSKLGLLKEHGIWILHTKRGRAGDAEFDAKVIYPHPFMLIIADGEFCEDAYLKKDGLFRANLPPRLLVITDSDDTKFDSWWVVKVKETQALLNAIKDVKIASETPTKAGDSENATIINLIWREWLRQKFDFLRVSGIDAEIGETYISSAFNDYVLPIAEGRASNFSFVLDHHGQNLSLDELGKDHFEAYPSSVKPTIERCNPDAPPPININPNFNQDELCKIVEGMVTKILIIDERVQQAYQSEYCPDRSSNPDLRSVKKEILYRAANIYIPSKDKLDLNKAEFDMTYEQRLFDEVKRISQESKFTGIDYIVIHLGVIEKILALMGQDKKEHDIRKFVKDLAQSEGANGNARVVITSGRGKPDNLPDEMPFIAYSVLSQYAIEVPFKSYLTQAVSATRLVGSN